MKIKQKQYGELEVEVDKIDNVVSIWNTQIRKKTGKRSVEVVQIEPNNVAKIIKALQQVLTSI